MAEVPTRVDDLDGSPADEEIVFGIDGKWLAIDLSKVNADTFREIMAPWIAAARPHGQADRKVRKRADRDRSAAIRAWAQQQTWAQQGDLQVGDRGRLRKEVIRRYENRMDQ